MKTTVKDVMTTRVIWVRPEASFKAMATALRENRVSAFPVIGQDDKVIGVVSETDMLAREAVTLAQEALPDGAPAEPVGLTAADRMTRPAVTWA
jgi:CBS-domain-containing membrane protein